MFYPVVVLGEGFTLRQNHHLKLFRKILFIFLFIDPNSSRANIFSIHFREKVGFIFLFTQKCGWNNAPILLLFAWPLCFNILLFFGSQIQRQIIQTFSLPHKIYLIHFFNFRIFIGNNCWEVMGCRWRWRLFPIFPNIIFQIYLDLCVIYVMMEFVFGIVCGLVVGCFLLLGIMCDYLPRHFHYCSSDRKLFQIILIRTKLLLFG